MPQAVAGAERPCRRGEVNVIGHGPRGHVDEGAGQTLGMPGGRHREVVAQALGHVLETASRPDVEGLERGHGLDQPGEQDPRRIAPRHVSQLVRAQGDLLVPFELGEGPRREAHLRVDDAGGEGDVEPRRRAHGNRATQAETRGEGGHARGQTGAGQGMARTQQAPQANRRHPETGQGEEADRAPQAHQGGPPRRGCGKAPARSGLARVGRLRNLLEHGGKGPLQRHDRRRGRGQRHRPRSGRGLGEGEDPAERLHAQTQLQARGEEAAHQRRPEHGLLEAEPALPEDETHERRPTEQDRAVQQVGQEPARQPAHRRPPFPRPAPTRRRSSARSAPSISCSETRWATRAFASPPKRRSTSSPTMDSRTSVWVTVGR